VSEAAVQAITALIYRYPELIDAGDFDGIAELFGRATLVSGDHRFPGSEVGSVLTDLVHVDEDRRPSTRHVVTNVVIDIDDGGTTAQARSYVTVFQARPGLALQPIVSAHHHDRFACVDGEWHFVERADFTDLVGDMSHHVKQPYQAGG
jgi:3-phenylpropionate/cinnamic acid dioxygenase small subunit